MGHDIAHAGGPIRITDENFQLVQDYLRLERYHPGPIDYRETEAFQLPFTVTAVPGQMSNANPIRPIGGGFTLTPIHTEGGGDCLFHAMVNIVNGDTALHAYDMQSMRRLLVSAMSGMATDPYHSQSGFLGFPAYLEGHRPKPARGDWATSVTAVDGRYGSDWDLQVFAWLFNYNIIVVSQHVPGAPEPGDVQQPRPFLEFRHFTPRPWDPAHPTRPANNAVLIHTAGPHGFGGHYENGILTIDAGGGGEAGAAVAAAPAAPLHGGGEAGAAVGTAPAAPLHGSGAAAAAAGGGGAVAALRSSEYDADLLRKLCYEAKRGLWTRDVVREFVTTRKVDVNGIFIDQNSRSHTPLITAINNNHAEFAGYLLDLGAEPNMRIPTTRTSLKGDTALTTAAYNHFTFENLELFRVLLKHGANSEQMTEAMREVNVRKILRQVQGPETGSV